MLCLGSIVSIPSSGGNSCSTFSFSDFGYHLGHPLPSLLLPGVFTTCIENHYPLIWFSRSFFLLSLTVLFFRRCRFSAERISTKVRWRHGAESLVGGVEDCRLSFLFPLSPRLSRISGRDPLL